MKIQVSALKDKPYRLLIDAPATEFPALLVVADKGGIEFDTSLTGQVVVEQVDDLVRVNGSLNVTVRLECGRCLTMSTSRLDVPLSLCYQKRLAVSVDHDVEELELAESDLGLVAYADDEIDLAPELEEEVIMALPQQFFCREDCGGLCPVCGQNLNLETCDCEQPVFHSGLAALKNLKID